MRRSEHGVVVVLATAAELEPLLAELHPDERALALAMSPIRQRDWVGGRAALRAALREQALPADGPVLPDDRGAPRLPPGASGSISHKAGWAAALAAPHRPGCSLGLDLEAAQPPRVDISRRVLTEDEQAALSDLADAPRGRAVTLRFSLKEALYKAIDPWVRRYVGFREVALQVHDDGRASARAIAPRLQDELAGVALELEWTELHGHWLCSARARRGG